MKAPAAVLLLLPIAAAAQDRFEIQVYDSEVAEARHFGAELHLNYVISGTTAVAPDGELPTQHVLHTTLEPHYGLFGWAEVGAYLQGALQPDDGYDFAGWKLRFKARWPEKLLDGRLGLAINFELSRVPASYEANVWGTEIRPIVDFRQGIFYVSFNPIVDTDLEGALAGKPQLEPALKLALSASRDIALGIETYAALGPIDGILPLSEQSHQLYGVIDIAGAWVDLNFGVGRGWGAADGWVAKAIIGFHPP
jgi:hypothetical protein